MMLTIISGRSGSGKSVALRALEDLGFYCVDNLPLNLLSQFIDNLPDNKQDIVVSIDVRNMPLQQGKIQKFLQDLDKRIDTNVIFLDADDKELVKRYSETRRLHPLSRNNMSLEQAIHAESAILSEIKEKADLVIDTTKKSIHDLSETICTRVKGRNARELILVFESFGFKYGLPTDADYVFDVRFLPNPHWVAELKPQTGLDQPVADFLSGHAEVNQLKDQICQFIDTWLPMLEKNNRSYVTVAIGCTGGQHRSVYIAQQISDYFKLKGHNVCTHHRTLEKR